MTAEPKPAPIQGLDDPAETGETPDADRTGTVRTEAHGADSQAAASHGADSQAAASHGAASHGAATRGSGTRGGARSGLTRRTRMITWLVVTALVAWFFFAWLVLDRYAADAAGESIGTALLILVLLSVGAAIAEHRSNKR